MIAMDSVPSKPPFSPVATIEAPVPQPVSSAQRIVAVDVLRGFAVLGLMAIHIFIFSQPVDLFGDPRAGLAYEGANRVFIWAAQVFVFGKFMFLFALLFGAGVMFFDRKFQDGELTDGTGLWYRRVGWLALIGVLHGVFLFFGDILLLYAICGLAALWWVRRLSPGVLLLLALASYGLGMILFIGLMWLSSRMMGEMSPDALDETMTSEAGQIAAHSGSYLDSLLLRLSFLANNIFLMFFTFWIASGIMMLGMALAKLGVVTGQRSVRFYAMLAVIGIGIGLPATAGLFFQLEASGFASERMMMWVIGGLLLAPPLSLGYLGTIMLLSKYGLLKPVQTALAAVGRMALTNYLLHSLLGALIFDGWGFGFFAQLEFPVLAGIVAAVWTINIVFSILWLRFFRFGPVEWLWRSLTYLKPQPMLRP